MNYKIITSIIKDLKRIKIITPISKLIKNLRITKPIIIKKLKISSFFKVTLPLILLDQRWLHVAIGRLNKFWKLIFSRILVSNFVGTVIIKRTINDRHSLSLVNNFIKRNN